MSNETPKRKEAIRRSFDDWPFTMTILALLSGASSAAFYFTAVFVWFAPYWLEYGVTTYIIRMAIKSQIDTITDNYVEKIEGDQ